MTTRLLLAVLALGATPAVLAAQHVHPAPAPASVQAPARAQDASPEPLTPAAIADGPSLSAETPVQCWWRSSSGAIPANGVR